MFSLDKDQQKKLDEWMAEKDADRYCGAIGGRYTYSFCDTNLGQVVKVTDDLTNTTIDLTDYDSW